MAGRKRKATDNSGSSRPSRSSRSAANKSGIPEIYHDMLVEADVQSTTASEDRPTKRKRPSQRRDQASQIARSFPDNPARKLEERKDKNQDKDEDENEDEDTGDVEFEDVVLPSATIQTIYRDSDEEEEEDDDDNGEEVFEDVDISSRPSAVGPAQDSLPDLELDLSARTKSTPTKAINRRKPINKEEKSRRIEIHKTNLLCLLAHVARRNRWCNDTEVQNCLQPLLTQKMVTHLNPPSHLTQFGQANSLKEGLGLVNNMFKTKFRVTERGMRRALWAETEAHLQDYTLPADSESSLEKSDFREAAKSLSGSRDVGAQLYCALLRAAGVEARLVCSLQPLSFSSAGPYMGASHKKKQRQTLEEKYGQLFKLHDSPEDPVGPAGSSAIPSPRRRLGHPNAAAFRVPDVIPGPSRQVAPPPKKIRESPYPVYWVEVLDEGHQRWQPTDPLVTESYWKPQKLEPPASDRENCMVYVISFEADGVATDVTRRYVKAYNAKTRRMRIEGVRNDGERWWRKALRAYSRPFKSDLDQIEANELAAMEAREPMPRNIADFKDHPVYALERHLRRYEVLVPNATSSGTVGAGSKAPLERIYRRRDVRTARSREKWYRLGREVLPNEIPVKFITKPPQAREDDLGEDTYQFGEGEANGTPIYTMDQTELYIAPPIVNGKVPKNRYGNLDLYVPSMVPEGGVYIADDFGAQAAFILGIDYAPALTGFQFSGRKGTAVLRGVVVAEEYGEAVRAVIDGIKDYEVEIERERRCREVLRMWRFFLMNLRIRQRIWAGVDSEDEDMEGPGLGDVIADKGGDEAADTDHSDEAGGGGFEIDEEYAGGFMID
ncbi:putative DNA repair protein rhp41 [Rosellinia necatrix]|uniref:Putative DNA repair protein rhp41 n=1 Tax=Rosellinia necatrix TaxID=77044 RepID=A0A1W2TG21_ROSNE|nr:putative DNA repair protein rhp41 [Rosellinia necatrix]